MRLCQLFFLHSTVISQFLTLTASSTTAIAHCRPLINELANHSKERNIILDRDWSICLLFTFYCLMFLYVPWT